MKGSIPQHAAHPELPSFYVRSTKKQGRDRCACRNLFWLRVRNRLRGSHPSPIAKKITLQNTPKPHTLRIIK